MDKIDLNNRIADQFSYAQLPKLEKLIKPLNSFGITHFTYKKFVGEDKFMVLSPYLPWIRNNFGYSLDQEFIVQSMLNCIRQQRNLLPWQVSASPKPLVEGLRVLNLNHGISFSRKKEDNVYEVFHFATANDNVRILGFYLKNFSTLKVFSDYFVDKMSDIIAIRFLESLSKLIRKYRK